MKLNSLYIDDYKLLKDFKIIFSKDVSILIGINGSGKSSILEAIAYIFSDATLTKKSRFGFKLEYELFFPELFFGSPATIIYNQVVNVELSSEKEGEKYHFKITSENKDIIEAINNEGLFSSIREIIPDNIVIYYSGLSENLEKICDIHTQNYIKQLRDFKNIEPRKFFYYMPQHFNLILLCLMAYEYGTDLKKYLESQFKITAFKSFTIKLKKPGSWGKNEKLDLDKPEFWGAKGRIDIFLKQLRQLFPKIEKTDNGVAFTYSDWGELENISALNNNEKQLFEILDATYQNELLEGIDIDIAKIENKNITIHSSQTLSEGEQQLITIIGLCELLLSENTLFLFDEPDTYLHPSWQSNFISEILKYAENAQFIITTHSPQLLSNANPEKSEVQIMEDGEIVEITPKYYGKDISQILYEMMGVESRNKKVAKALSKLFKLIEDEKLEESKVEFKTLSELLGDNDPAIVRAKTQLDYLEESVK